MVGSKFCQGGLRIRKKKDGAGSPAPSCRASYRAVWLVVAAARLELVVPVGEGAIAEVELLLVEVSLAVPERHLVRRVLGLGRHALALDTRGLAGHLSARLGYRARAEVRPLGTIRAATPSTRRILREDHRRDGQRRNRNRYDSRPPHVTLRRVEIHCIDYTASTLSLAIAVGSNG